MRCLSGLAALALAAAPPSLASARHAAQRFFDAIARADRPAICHALTANVRRELMREAHAKTCVQAAREIPRQLGRYPISKVERKGDRVVVWIDDSDISDSGQDNIELVRSHGRWLVSVF